MVRALRNSALQELAGDFVEQRSRSPLTLTVNQPPRPPPTGEREGRVFPFSPGQDHNVIPALLGKVYLAQAHPQEALAEIERETGPTLRLQGLALANHALGRKKRGPSHPAQKPVRR